MLKNQAKMSKWEKYMSKNASNAAEAFHSCIHTT